MGHLYQQGNSRRYNWPSMLSPFNTCRLDTSLKITHLETEWIRKEDSDWKHKATTASFQLWRGTNFVKNVWLAETIQTNLVQKFCPTFLGIVVTPPRNVFTDFVFFPLISHSSSTLYLSRVFSPVWFLSWSELRLSRSQEVFFFILMLLV